MPHKLADQREEDKDRAKGDLYAAHRSTYTLVTFWLQGGGSRRTGEDGRDEGIEIAVWGQRSVWRRRYGDRYLAPTCVLFGAKQP